MVGLGVSPPVQPHHRGPTCPGPDMPEPCVSSSFSICFFQLLEGALVGGPDNDQDNFTDDRTDYIMGEVALDYNAGFQALTAGLKAHYCG